MKKIIALLLALMFCIVPLVSCGGNDTETGTETTAETGEYDVKSAAAFLKNMYKQYLTEPETSRDFTVVSQVMNGGVPYNVTWTTNTEDVKVIPDEANKQVKIDVDENASEAINYELTATVADPAGVTEKVVFKLVVPANDGPVASVISTPAADTAYKFYLFQAKSNKVLYIDSGVSGRYLSMTEDFSQAIDVFAEVVDGGYKFFTTIDGAKKYIGVYSNDEGKTSVGYLDSTDCVYSYNSETFAWETAFGEDKVYLGTYNTYDTVSASFTSYIKADNTRVEQFPLELVTEAVKAPAAPETPETPEQPEDPNLIIGGTANADVVSAPNADTAYKLYFYQSKAGKVLYINGGTDQDRYLTTTTDFSKALDVTAEAANGGFKFSVKIDGAKKYIDLFLNADNKPALRYADSTNCAFKYNKETFAWEATAGEETYYLGTYGTFETVSASKTSYINKDNTRKEQFPLELVTKTVTVTPPTGSDTPEQPENPQPPVSGETTPEVDNGTYRLYIDQASIKKILYLDGGVKDDRYLTMTEDYSKAIPAKFEAVKGGYKISVTINGAKKYIDLSVVKGSDGKDKASLKYAASTNCVFNENKATKAWETTVGGTAYYLGTYKTYDTVSASLTSYITAENTGKTQFPLIKTTKKITPYPAEQPSTPPVEPQPGASTGTVVSAPAANKAYKFYLKQAKEGKVLYIDGGLDAEKGRYLTMTEDYSKALDVYAESVNGGYKFFVKINGAKKYIDLYHNEEGKSSLRYADSTKAVFKYNATTFAWETTVDEKTYYIGTYNNFVTVSASDPKYISADNTRVSQFPLELTTEKITDIPTPPAETEPPTQTPTGSGDYVINKGNNKVHTHDCPNAEKMSEKNRIDFEGTIDELKKQYPEAVAAGCCKPF